VLHKMCITKFNSNRLTKTSLELLSIKILSWTCSKISVPLIVIIVWHKIKIYLYSKKKYLKYIYDAYIHSLNPHTDFKGSTMPALASTHHPYILYTIFIYGSFHELFYILIFFSEYYFISLASSRLCLLILLILTTKSQSLNIFI
jgi:hypothetical protein